MGGEVVVVVVVARPTWSTTTLGYETLDRPRLADGEEVTYAGEAVKA